MRNKKALKRDLLFASKKLIDDNLTQTSNNEYLEPVYDFIEVINLAVEDALNFYGVLKSDMADCQFIETKKVSLKNDVFEIEYLITLKGLVRIFEIDGFSIFVGDFNPEEFIGIINKHTQSEFTTSAKLDILKGVLDCTTSIQIDNLIDYTKRVLQYKQLF